MRNVICIAALMISLPACAEHVDFADESSKDADVPPQEEDTGRYPESPPDAPAPRPTSDAGGDTSTPPPPPPPPPGVKAPELGSGDHTATSVTLTQIAGPSNELKNPRDLAFNPRKPDELWVVNWTDESAVIISNASTSSRTSQRRRDPMAPHFMARVTAIDFGADATTFGVPGTFATCGESRNTMDGTQPADDFMGPTLWSSDLSIFAIKNPYGLGSHIDMLHTAPLCMGIAHQEANIYWTLTGLTGSIVKFDFKNDHGVGHDDHSDGVAYRYVMGQVKYVSTVPSGMVYRAADAMLYFSDTGNGRVAKLDTKSGKVGKTLPTSDDSTFYEVTGATLTDVVPASSGLVSRPAGLEIKGDLIYVADDANGRITAFTLSGERVNWLDTGLPKGSLGGMAFGPDGKLYFADRLGNRVLRIDPKA